MPNNNEPIRVRLLADLVSYHPAFTAGVEGTVEDVPGELDCFFRMRLANGAALRVLWKSVERIP